MDETKQSTGDVPAPAGMVIYHPDKPLYEVLHTCVVLYKIRDMAEEKTGEEGEEGEDRHYT